MASHRVGPRVNCLAERHDSSRAYRLLACRCPTSVRLYQERNRRNQAARLERNAIAAARAEEIVPEVEPDFVAAWLVTEGRMRWVDIADEPTRTAIVADLARHSDPLAIAEYLDIPYAEVCTYWYRRSEVTA